VLATFVAHAELRQATTAKVDYDPQRADDRDEALQHAHVLMARRVTFAWRCYRLPDELSVQCEEAG
jgi:hypothetical protein